MVVWQQEGSPGGRSSIVFDAAQEGVPELGYIVENDLVRAALWRQAGEASSIDLIAGAAPSGLTSAPDAITLYLADGAALRAKLIVGADGGSSWLRSELGVPCQARPYGQQAVVAHVAGAKPHRQTAWQRFLADGPLALLPLADGRSSIVWSCSDSRARELRLTTPRTAFPLAKGHTSRYTGLRFALIGDAAHQVHPLAGQGVNLGFLDAAALAETLATHLSIPRADPGDPRALRRFERWRKGENLAAFGALDALHHLFTSRVPGLPRAAGLGLGLVDRLSPLKSLLADRAMGRRGDLPRVARSA
jgi:2-octaprenylphenol hydroxylase